MYIPYKDLEGDLCPECEKGKLHWLTYRSKTQSEFYECDYCHDVGEDRPAGQPLSMLKPVS